MRRPPTWATSLAPQRRRGRSRPRAGPGLLALLLAAVGCAGGSTRTAVTTPAQPSLAGEPARLTVLAGNAAVLTLEREAVAIEIDGVWRDATGQDAVVWTIERGATAATLRPTWPAAATAHVGGLRVTWRLRGDRPLRSPRWTQLGYAKYSPPGIASIRRALPRDDDGGVPDYLGDPGLGIDALVAGTTLDPQVGWWTTTLRAHPDLPLVGIGACAAARYKTRLAAGRQGNDLRVMLEQGGLGDGVTVAAGDSLAFEPLCVATGTSLPAVDQALADRFEPVAAPPRTTRAAPQFFSTWHADFADVTLDSIRAQIAALERQGYDFDALQVDDGYQRAWGDWLVTADGFGGDLTDMVRVVEAAGYTAGLWLTPSVVAPDSTVARRHPDWLLRDATGAPVRCNTCSLVVPEFYALDWSHPGVAAWLTRVIGHLGRIGVRLFKIDFLVMSAAEGRGHDPSQTALQRYHRMLATVRAALPDDAVVWSATYPIMPTLGWLHGYRVAGDLGFPFFDDLPVAHRFHYLRALAVRGTWLSRFGWIEPDAFFARAQPRGPRTEALAALGAMAGGMYTIGERPGDLRRDLDPARLPAALRNAIGSRRPFLPADPFEHVVDPWEIFQSQEGILGYAGGVTAQPHVWYRPADDGRSADVLVFNLTPVTQAIAADLRPALRAIGVQSSAAATRRLEIPALGYRLLRVER